MHLPYFKQKHLSLLYKTGEDHLQQIEQWKRTECWDEVARYDAKLEAIVELLETIIVFNHGDGLDNFRSPGRKQKTIRERFESFEFKCKE